MPPKKPAANPADAPVPSSSEARMEVKAEKMSDVAALRKLAALQENVALREHAPHPSTVIMVKEALQVLDSRKGVSSQAIQRYIKEKYPSVDVVRLKHLVRKALKKGIENGTYVRPANSTVTTGAMGKFRLAPKVKESKPKTENMDPNVQTAPKAAKDGAKKPKKTGATKKKDPANGQTKSSEDSKPPRKSKKEAEGATSKVPPAKKPKAKKAEEKDGEGTSKAAKTGKTAAKAGSAAPASKATGKRGKKAAE